jgi:intein-encoded DNA endonuclease-like protein
MKWAYIAGFMDGEGSINFSRSTATFSIEVSLAQSGAEGKLLLKEMRMFLEGHGIRSSILRNKQKKTLAKKPMYALRMGQRASVQLFLTNLMPYLRIKKVKAQDALRTFKLFPSMKPDGGWRTRRENLAIFKRKPREVSN